MMSFLCYTIVVVRGDDDDDGDGSSDGNSISMWSIKILFVSFFVFLFFYPRFYRAVNSYTRTQNIRFKIHAFTNTHTNLGPRRKKKIHRYERFIIVDPTIVEAVETEFCPYFMKIVFTMSNVPSPLLALPHPTNTRA